jgi:hypothetical protein
MGLSSLKGNSGYLGIDKRSEVGSTGTTGNMSVRKVYLERRSGNLEPVSPTPSNILFEDDFASGDLSNWTVYNGSEPSEWEVNTSSACLNSSGVAQTIPSGSTYAAFISNDGGTSNDYASYTDVHMTFEFTIPSDITITSLTLEFDWMCFGERSSGLGSYDYGYVNYMNGFTPSAGVEYTTNTTSRERIIGSNTSPNTDSGKFTGDGTSSRNNSASGGFVYENITIDSSEITQSGLWCNNNCTRQIMFSWASDSSIVDNPGWTIANVKLTYNE